MQSGTKLKKGRPLIVAGTTLTFSEEVYVHAAPPDGMPDPWFRLLDSGAQRGGYELTYEPRLTKPL